MCLDLRIRVPWPAYGTLTLWAGHGIKRGDRINVAGDNPFFVNAAGDTVLRIRHWRWYDTAMAYLWRMPWRAILLLLATVISAWPI